jgi:hypothetical protein
MELVIASFSRAKFKALTVNRDVLQSIRDCLNPARFAAGNLYEDDSE